jgi:hypothetical protein
MLKKKIKDINLTEDIKKCYNRMYPEFKLKEKKQNKKDIFLITDKKINKKNKKK